MNRLKWLGLAAFAGILLTVTAPKLEAQVSVTVGAEPVCPYGYNDYPPYSCAPYGYYGPEWFVSGVFIGAGPWFHGPHDFHGHVDNHFDVHHGYRGHLPERGERRARENHVDHMDHFRGNEVHDGRGHVEQRGGHQGH